MGGFVEKERTLLPYAAPASSTFVSTFTPTTPQSDPPGLITPRSKGGGGDEREEIRWGGENGGFRLTPSIETLYPAAGCIWSWPVPVLPHCSTGWGHLDH